VSAGAPARCSAEPTHSLSPARFRRHLAIAGRLGHVGTFDVSSSSLHSELHLNETTRAITWLHDESFYAVAQKRFVYIYDKQGLEVHQLRSHVEVEAMQFLPYHFLLATIVSLCARGFFSQSVG
jgi:U3 small nucleolar RNA-associated protein 7